MEGETLDIVCAYRNPPLSLHHKAYVASKWCDRVYIYQCAMEGLSSSGNIQGTPADALVSILKKNGVNEVFKWVDDFCHFCVPTPNVSIGRGNQSSQFSIDIISIFSITDPLSMPWHPIDMKGQDFTSTVTYVGFLWDLQNQSISLPSKKPLKYLNKSRTFLASAKLKVSWKEVMPIHCTLQHIMSSHPHNTNVNLLTNLS